MLDEAIISKLKDKKIENTSGIYVILNTITNKVYIGSSKKIRNRKNGHLSSLRRNIHQNNILQNSWNKYGEKNFIFLVIENCNEYVLLDREQYYLDKYKTYLGQIGYNLSSNSRHISHGISPQREKYLHGHEISMVNNKRVCKVCYNKKYNNLKLKPCCGHGHIFDTENTGQKQKINAHGDKYITRYCKKCEQVRYLKKEPLKFCRKGHEFTSDNIKWGTQKNGKPYKTCRLCNILNQRESRARKKTNDQIHE